MDPLSAAASIIGVLQLSEAVLGSCYRFIGKVKEAAADINRVIQQIGYLTTILRDLEALTKPEENGQTSIASSTLQSLAGDHGPLAACAKALGELKTKLPDGPIGLRQKLQWPFESKKVNAIMDQIMAQVPVLELAVIGDNYGVTLGIKESLEDTKRREEREAVLNWLRCADPTVKHLASRRLHQPGSNGWILESDDFKQWREKSGETLWLHGIPGAGKTVICSSIIDEVERYCKDQPASGRLAYYYFDFSDQNVQNLDIVLRCLLWQLCKDEHFLPRSAAVLYESCDNGRKQPDDEVLAAALFDLMSEDQSKRSYVIIDALDECPAEKREQFYKLVLDRLERQPSACNILFTSRKESDIEQRMMQLGDKLRNVPILTGDVNADVRLHVNRFISEHRTMRDWSKDLKKEIEDTISEGAQGMFRWAVCQLETIKNCRQAGSVRKTLKNLPKTLDDTYDRILASIPDETWHIARSALMLLTHSIRPLTIQELAEGMVVDTEELVFDPDEQRLTNYRHVLEICSSLVSVNVSKDVNPNNVPWLVQKLEIERNHFHYQGAKHLEVVQFAHFSVKEYMTLERAKSAPSIARFSFSSTAAHRSIAQLSLVYLRDFSRGVRLNKIDFQAFPFLAYAAQHWPEHWRRQLPLEDQEGINSLIQQILDTEEDHSAYINYINICRPDALVDQQYYFSFAFRSQQARSLETIPEPLYYTSQLGHLQLCEWLLDERGCDVNSIRGMFGQAIQIASRFGHKDVVKLLLDRGAQVDRSCGEYSYPLQAAAYGGHTAVVKLLLENKADVNGVGGKFGSALIAACDQGHLDVARVLLDHGADLDIICVNKGKALNVAAGVGNKALVQLLLRKGADINDTCGNEGGALYAAAKSGDLDMVRMLVAAGADVNLRSGYRCNALQAACSNPDKHEGGDGKRFIEIARLLLKHGADPNMHGGEYGDALQAAVEGSAKGNVLDNNIDMVNLVLDHGADISYKGGKYRSAMHATVFCGNISAAHALIQRGVELDDDIFLLAVENERKTVIPLLLERGVDVNAQNKSGTALQFAIHNRDETTTQILLKNPDIEIDALGGSDGVTALYNAVERKNKDLVRQLLDRGADVNRVCNKSTPFLASLWDGDMELITMLLDHGADVNVNIPGSDTALIRACSRNNEALVRFLLDRGADINLWNDSEGDALQQAAYGGNESLVKLLLSRGADVKGREGGHGSCLEAAIMKEHSALVRFLIDAGANVNFSGTLEELREKGYGFGGPLSGSIWYKQEGLTELLLQRGANPNWSGREHYGTPLQEAIERSNEEAVKLLLQYGADVNLIGGSHGSALAVAMSAGDQESCEQYVSLLLEAGADINLQAGGREGCPLGMAVYKGNRTMVERLLDLGADINVPAGSSGSPLQTAINMGDLEIFRLLLDRGADPNFTSGDNETPLCAAARSCKNTMLKELLEHGADPKLADSAVVVSCAYGGNLDGLQVLLEHGANIDEQNGVRGLALHEAAHGTSIEIVKYLLDHGVDVNSQGGKYGNALMAILGNAYASRENQVGPLVQLLLDSGASVNSPPSKDYTSILQSAIEGFNHSFVDRLIEAGADVHAYDPRLGTALSSAAQYGRTEIMKQFVEKGADPTLGSEKYGSPLQAASRRHKIAAVEYLLSLGVDPNQLLGKTGYALHAACRYGSEDGLRVLKLLADHGADPNARGGKYETALQAAAKHGHLENVKWLLSMGADPTIEGGRYGSPLKAALAGKNKHYHVANYLKRHIKSANA